VTNTEREQAKRLVYGIMYGMGPNSLSEILDVTKKEAKEFIDSFLQSYPEVNEFIEETKRVSLKIFLTSRFNFSPITCYSGSTQEPERENNHESKTIVAWH
jgi:hypothetical protein